ncbi:MAG TPA: phenylalanine--tRNA ligase beta subunit-related protein, partial [Candidatus Binatia bacterium]
MKFTFNWLKEFVKVTAGPEELAKLLTMAGLEVESLVPQREAETNAEDWLFEIAVTPNRGDCLGIAGIAREVAALTGGKLLSMPSSPAKKDSTTSKRISLTIEDPRLCPRYSARIVDDVAISAAPVWLRYRLECCGIRSINNVVDITNYVMLETGQPLHAFDLDRLPAKQIVVKAAGEVRKFTTLDGVERELLAEDLLICAGETPVALAGVMGGMDSEVRASTRSILLESANFAPTSIRRTAKRLALHSEASHRFERGVDPEGTIAALNRAVYLLIE